MEFDLPPSRYSDGVFSTQSVESARKPWNLICPLLGGAVGPPHRDCRKNIRKYTLWHLGRKNRKLTLCASLGRRGRGGREVGLLGGVWSADELFDVVDVDSTNH